MTAGTGQLPGGLAGVWPSIRATVGQDQDQDQDQDGSALSFHSGGLSETTI